MLKTQCLFLDLLYVPDHEKHVHKKLIRKYLKEFNPKSENSIDILGLFTQDGHLLFSNDAFDKLCQVYFSDKNDRRTDEKALTLQDIKKLSNNLFSSAITQFVCGDRHYVAALCEYSPEKDIGSHYFAAVCIEDLLPTLTAESLSLLFKGVAQLSQLNHENDLIFNNIFDLITITDSNGRIIRTNSAIETKFGINRQNILNTSVYELEQNHVLSKSVTIDVLKTKKPCTLIQDTQLGRRLLVTSTPIFDLNNNLYRVFNVSQDITTINALEARVHEMEKIMVEYERRLAYLKSAPVSPNLCITSSIQMESVFETIRQITEVNSTVLIEGETGVGKGYLAQTIHNTSTQKDGPFIKVNCGAIPETLFESELFGYAKGSFTGALQTGKTGLVQAADGGTLFLDEIGDLPLTVQIKILELIQTKSFYPIGSTELLTPNIRIIAATNRNLRELVEERRFREDLYYRLSVIPLYVPPLRERKNEIPILINQFLQKYCAQFQKKKRFSKDCMEFLVQCPWPGNIRELENTIERLVVTTPGTLITPSMLPPQICPENKQTNAIEIKVNHLIPMSDAQKQMEEALLKKAFEQYSNISTISKILDVHRTTISRKKHTGSPSF